MKNIYPSPVTTEARAESSDSQSSPADPLKAARQAIRSQAAARDYAERHLAQAQADIQRLQEKLRQARHERNTAQDAARSAVAAKITAERSLQATEAALRDEKIACDRAERSLANAQATIRDLQAKLGTAGQALQVVQGELAAEREKATIRPSVVPQIGAAAGDGDHCATATRRPGRPRKAGAVPTPGEAPGKAVKPVQAATEKQSRRSGKPVKWWVKDWNRQG